MRRQYDDFTQLKLKDMSKNISNMTYTYINPTTNEPTRVPASHYEKILNQVTENYMSDITHIQFLTIMFNQLSALKKEDEKYFNQALLCMDLGINPKDMGVDEQIALNYTTDYINYRKKSEKKDFHLLDDSIVETYENSKEDREIQSSAIESTNEIEDDFEL